MRCPLYAMNRDPAFHLADDELPGDRLGWDVQMFRSVLQGGGGRSRGEGGRDG